MFEEKLLESTRFTKFFSAFTTTKVFQRVTNIVMYLIFIALFDELRRP